MVMNQVNEGKRLNQTYKVTKSNDLIESTYKLSLQENRIIATLISMIEPHDAHFQIYKFNVKEFAEMIGVKGKIYSYIKEIVTGLQEKTVEIPTENSTLVLNWLSSAEYFEKEGYIELEISSKLKPYLLELKQRFTSYQLRYILRLRSFYSARIYELLKQYEFVKHKTRTVDIQTLREWLGFINEYENKYSMYGHFKDRVLKKAHTEINEKTDIGFEFEEVKKGKKVVAVKFTIIPKREKEGIESVAEEQQSPLDQPLFEQIQHLAKKEEYLFTYENFSKALSLSTSIWGDNAHKNLYKMVLYVNAQKNKESPVGLLIHLLKEKYEHMKKGNPVNVDVVYNQSNEPLPDWFKEQKEQEQMSLFSNIEEKNENKTSDELSSELDKEREAIRKSIERRQAKRSNK